MTDVTLRPSAAVQAERELRCSALNAVPNTHRSTTFEPCQLSALAP
jgi:hypothetical protein